MTDVNISAALQDNLDRIEYWRMNAAGKLYEAELLRRVKSVEQDRAQDPTLPISDVEDLWRLLNQEFDQDMHRLQLCGMDRSMKDFMSGVRILEKHKKPFPDAANSVLVDVVRVLQPKLTGLADFCAICKAELEKQTKARSAATA